MKDKFWKIMAIIFLLWLFLCLWNSTIQVDFIKTKLVKINKLTGQVWYFKEDVWKKVYI